MATKTYVNQVPNLNQLNPNDIVQYGGNVTYQSPEIQELFRQNAAEPYYDPNSGGVIGLRMLKPYASPSLVQGGQVTSNTDVYDVNNIYNQAAGRLPSAGEITDIQTMIKNETNPALAVSMIQQYAKNKLGSATPTNNGTDTATNTTDITGGITGGMTGGMTGTGAGINLMGQAENPVTQKSINDLLGQQQTLNQQIYESEKAKLEQKKAGAIQGQKDVGNRLVGSMKRILGKSGAMTTSSGGQALIGKQQEIENQIAQLGAAYDNSINELFTSFQSGNLAAAEKAQNALLELQKQIETANQNRTQNLLSFLKLQQDQSQFESSLDFDKSKFTWQQAMDTVDSKLKEAGITGMYEGSPTWEKQIGLIEADLKQQGINIDRAQLDETIRANKAQEAIAYAKMALDKASSGSGLSKTDVDTLGAMAEAYVIENPDAPGTYMFDANRLENIVGTGQKATREYSVIAEAAKQIAEQKNAQMKNSQPISELDKGIDLSGYNVGGMIGSVVKSIPGLAGSGFKYNLDLTKGVLNQLLGK